ncbi:hypothetical protein BJX96DRAFT_50718 [Aspergillus floccosus]
MGSSKRHGKPRNQSPPQVESPDTEMEEPVNGGIGDKSDDEPSDAHAPECDDSTDPSTPCKASNASAPSTPNSGYHEGEESRLTVKPNPPKTLVGAVSDICEMIRKPFSSADRDGPGYAYVFYDPSEDGDMYKIGQSKYVSKRENLYKRKCNMEGWVTTSRPRFGTIWGHERLEKLAQKQLGNSNFKFKCFCGTEHEEFFKGEKETALDVLDVWTKWLWQRPYDDNGQLKPFWEDRLELLELMHFSAFNCDKENCPSKDESAQACQGCLMEGWKAWTTPTITDERGLVTNGTLSAHKPVRQAQFPWPMVFWRAFLFLCLLYVPVLSAGNLYLVSCLLEGGLALGFYPSPQRRVPQMFSESGVRQMFSQLEKVLQLGSKQKKNSPKGKQPVAHNKSPPETPSRSLSRIRSTPPMDASPRSPSEQAVARRKQGHTKNALPPSSPSPSLGSLPQSSSKDNSSLPLRRSPRLMEKAMATGHTT